MSGPFAYPERVPKHAVRRLQDNLSALLTAIDAACQTGDPLSREVIRWRRAETHLQQEQAAIHTKAEAFYKDERQSLLHHAAELRLLGRRMDGYPLRFAPEETMQRVVEQRRLLVLTAWQIAAAASGSEAAGL